MNNRLKATLATTALVGTLLSIGVPSAPAPSPANQLGALSGTHAYAVAARTERSDNVIRYFSADHEPLGDVLVPFDYLNAAFIAGNWVPGTSASVLALKRDDNDIIRGEFLDENGDRVGRLNFGVEEQLGTILALNYDGDSYTDLAVLNLDESRATVLLNPGQPGSNAEVKVPVPNRVDIARLIQDGPEDLAFVKRADSVTPGAQDANKKKKKKQKKRLRKLNKRLRKLQKKNVNGKNDGKIAKIEAKLAKLGGGSGVNYLEYTDLDGSARKVTIEKGFAEYLPLVLEGQKVAFAKVGGRRVEIVGQDVTPISFNKKRRDFVYTGNFLGGNTTGILIASEGGSMIIGNPLTGETTTTSVTVAGTQTASQQFATGEFATANNSKRCTEYARLLREFTSAIGSGDISRLQSVSNQITALGPSVAEDCSDLLDSQPIGGGGFSGTANPGSALEGGIPLFTDGIGTFIADSFLFNSNTGDFYGPCDYFMDLDGNLGFLAKNSDHGGIVYLTPGAGYANGRILDYKTLKKIQDAEYTGIANGGRGHFRTGGSLPKASHVFAADKTFENETHCWRIPAGRSRYD